MIVAFIEYKVNPVSFGHGLLKFSKLQEDALKICDRFDALLVDKETVKSLEELALAEFLAKKSFSEGSNIAKKFKYEFLLWLTGKRDIKSAMKISEPRDKKVLLILFEKKEKKKLLNELNAKERKFKLKENADALALEKISLSRI